MSRYLLLWLLLAPLERILAQGTAATAGTLPAVETRADVGTSRGAGVGARVGVNADVEVIAGSSPGAGAGAKTRGAADAVAKNSADAGKSRVRKKH